MLEEQRIFLPPPKLLNYQLQQQTFNCINKPQQLPSIDCPAALVSDRMPSAGKWAEADSVEFPLCEIIFVIGEDWSCELVHNLLIWLRWHTIHAWNKNDWLFTATLTYRKLQRVKMGWWVLDKECVGSEHGTADVTFCPLHYRKEANTDESFLQILNVTKLILLFKSIGNIW